MDRETPKLCQRAKFTEAPRRSKRALIKGFAKLLDKA